MEWGDTGTGAGVGGFITAVAMALGFKSRLNKLERDAMYKDACDRTHKPIDVSLKRIEEKLDKLILRRRNDRTE